MPHPQHIIATIKIRNDTAIFLFIINPLFIFLIIITAKNTDANTNSADYTEFMYKFVNFTTMIIYDRIEI